MDQSEQEQLRRAIEKEVRAALRTHVTWEVETDDNEYEFKWRDGQAVVHTEYDNRPPVDFIFKTRVELVAVRMYNE